MYLDYDFIPAPLLSGRLVTGPLAKATKEALKLLDAAEEGQIGIYADCTTWVLMGYAIKYRGQAPYFEAAES